LGVTTGEIKALREMTGAGIMDCKRALEEVSGDQDKAQEILVKRGIAAAAKKASRETNEGIVDTYIHSGGRMGAMVEVNCETDFVANTPDFKELTHDIAMQVVALSPKYISREDVPESDDSDPEAVCLMEQKFIKDDSKTVTDVVNEAVGKLGENLRIRRFVRFSLGE